MNSLAQFPDSHPASVVIKGKDDQPALTLSRDGVEIGPGWDGPEWIAEQLRAAFLFGPVTSLGRDELREALADVVDREFDDYRPIYSKAGRCVDSNTVDALLAGPVGDLLAENERLTRWKSEALPVMDGLQELGRALNIDLGQRITGEQALERVESLKSERDQALATLDAVRKYADEREANGRRDRTVHSIRIASDLRRILDGADTERPEPTGSEVE